MSLKKKLLEWVAVFAMLIAYTIFVIYICSLPISTKINGWITPSSGIVFKTDQGYVSIGNGEILDFGKNMRVRVTFEKVDGGVAQ